MSTLYEHLKVTNIHTTPPKLKADPETPPELAKKLVAMISYEEGDRWYEPFRGKNRAFYNAMPEPKDWAEITEGRDFFTYMPFDGHCEHIVTNPPFQTYVNGKWSNAYIPILERCMNIATKTIAFLISHRLFNSLTPHRLTKYKKNNWTITKIHVVSIKKWYGRYYFVVFEKNKDSIITWDTYNY